MKKILGRKQTTNNAKWLEALQTIETLVSRKELEEQAKKTVATIKNQPHKLKYRCYLYACFHKAYVTCLYESNHHHL